MKVKPEPKRFEASQVRRLSATALAHVKGGLAEVSLPATDGSKVKEPA